MEKSFRHFPTFCYGALAFACAIERDAACFALISDAIVRHFLRADVSSVCPNVSGGNLCTAPEAIVWYFHRADVSSVCPEIRGGNLCTA